MYRIIQVLNNNVALVKNENNEQAIAMGKGIVFNKKKGDLIAKDQVDKLFELRTTESMEDFSNLLKDIPIDFVTTTYEIIDHAVKDYNYPVQRYIYVTLTDHLFASYQRLLSKNEQVNYIPDLHKSYPVPYKIAADALQILKNRLGIDLPADEVKSIALHFINAFDVQADQNIKLGLDKQLEKLMQEELERNGIYRTKKNASYYDRLMIHIKYFAERIMNSNQDDLQVSNQITNDLKIEYPKAFRITQFIKQLIKDRLNIDLSLSEQLYLTIHIQRLL